MISEEQKSLASYVKEVHLSLRRRARQIGAEKAWEEHVQNEEVLCKYADSMKNLAENYWSFNNKNEGNAVLCRIEWIIKCILNYFQKGGFQDEFEKERKKITLLFQRGILEEELHACHKYMFQCATETPRPPFRLLDVGSCYNPFKKFDFLTVYPIDLYPAIPEVKKCDFTNVKVLATIKDNWFSVRNLSEIPSDYFDVVVFSLFLEYLPSPMLRYKACENAYKSLKANGLLLIVTPDSKHATANSANMKMWKLAAACIGFNRIKIEKLRYLYCMAFRKSVSFTYPLMLNKMKREDYNPEKMFIIPQDSIDYKIEEAHHCNTEEEESQVKLTFRELPFS